MLRLSLAFLTAAAGIMGVNAHAYVASVTTGGVAYPGWAPFTDPYLNPVPVRVERRILDNGPVTDVYNVNITCNKGGNIPTTLFANVTAGSTVKFQWDQWPNGLHSGPVMTYMAKCPNGCESFKGDTGSPWFKIDQSGYNPTLSPPWASDRLSAQGASWTVTIPKSIANGEYLLINGKCRHEILALHVASTVGGAQFYPHCFQIKVTGGGSAIPSGVALPGVYNPTEPGILTQLWWYSPQNTSATYTIPGGPVWQG
ncbi:Polysaccharide monooxygenase Cel61a [Leucoagaricus sp. SymC.cos]|nr:Polysaccharide monooxygenase Cel61a [Leucoagaricus sp. SymC.cos]